MAGELYEPAAGLDFRRTMSRVGVSYAAFLLAADGAVRLIWEALWAFLPPEAYDRVYYSDLAASLIGDGGLYLVGLPVLLALLHWLLPDTAPAPRPLGGPRPFTERQFARLFLAGFALMLLGALIADDLGWFLEFLRGTAIPDPLEGAISGSVWGDFFFLCMAAPIGEEFLFRWLLYKKLAGFGETAYILTSGLMFGLFHGNFEQFFYATALGWLLAWAVCRTKGMLWPVLLHALMNFTAGVLPSLLEMLEGGWRVYCGLEAVLAVLGALVLLGAARRQRPAPPPGPLPPSPGAAAVLNPGMLAFGGYCLYLWLTGILA